MTIIETIEFFERLLKEASSKREIRIYNSFIGILSNLKNRDLSNDELQMIQKEIDTLDFKANHKNKRKSFSKKLNLFKKYLKEKFDLISEGYYTAIGMSLGMCFGVAIGSSLGSLGVSSGLAFGMLIGILIGRTKDNEAKKQNRVLSTKM